MVRYFAYEINGLNELTLRHLINVLIREGVGFEATFCTSDWMLEYNDISESVMGEMNEIIRGMNKTEASIWEGRLGRTKLIGIIPSR